MDFTKQIQKAEEAARRRNYDFAVQLYQQILEIDPDQGEARAGLRQSLKKRWDLKGGGSFLRSLSGAGPLALAKTLRKAGRRDACAKALESYLATNPVDEEANLMLGMVLEELGHTKSAYAVYEFVTEVAPKSPEGFKRAGAMSARLGETERALEYYEKALGIDPRDQEAIKARKDLAAERALTRSNAPEVQHSRDQIRNKSEAQELERTQRMHLSDDELRAQVERLEARYADDKSPELMAQLAETHERLKDFESALDWAERALSYRKDSLELAAKAGDLRARVMKKQIAEAGKRGDEARANELEREMQRFEVEDHRRRVALRPADPVLRLQLGKRLLRLAEWDEAMVELQKAVADPRAAREARVLLAQCFQGKGYTDLARKEYLRVLEGVTTLDERAKEVLYNLGAIAEAEGNSSDARGYYSRIFETDVGYRDVADKMERLK
ncbi:MAG: tetratricopeptide repeat protein [Planctomycetes bacterium]|nr:tetratricopeptide repeat protein [Planctomycetota bacterium]